MSTPALEQLLQDSVQAGASLNSLPDLSLRIHAAQSQLLKYLELLKRWNERMDLVAPASDEMLISRHLLDSAIAWLLLEKHDASVHERITGVADIGSGAGLPGVVIALLAPERRVCLLEPREKRTVFLAEAVRALGLKNVTVLRQRIETVDAAELKTLGVWVTRATGIWESILESAQNTCLEGGQILCCEHRVDITKEPHTAYLEYALPPDSAQRALAIRVIS